MNKKELTIKELTILEEEIDDILKYELPFILKYQLTSLNTKIKQILVPAKKIKNDLVVKYGEPDPMIPGNIILKSMIQINEFQEIENQKYIQYLKEYSPIEQQKEEITFKELKLSSFSNVNSSKVYHVLFSLLTED